ncbi:MAG: hypothetical protein PHV85_04010 [Desulfovibrionaceae bacterium]|nr:hypothetical protein [Desulfovibrionaceae bacterium]MDD4951695.1 hypothetical protein [Desulfovibrionaceae bacterium]
MAEDRFSQTIEVRGESYDFDPEAETALVPCEQCGHMNEVACQRQDGGWVFYSFSCENCGHFNTFD